MSAKLKKVDSRLKTLIENCLAQHHRSMFVIVGEKASYQVPILYAMLNKLKAETPPTVLWAYKKELQFSSNQRKRKKQLDKMVQSGLKPASEDDPLYQFENETTIDHCFYKDTHRILGRTYGVCVLQDFEAITPNILARTVETVEGGGAVIILLRSMTSYHQFYTMVMDVHSRYRTESHQDVVGRFNERFLLSLADCASCLVLTDKLEVLPFSSKTLHMTALPRKPLDERKSSEQVQLKRLQTELLQEKDTEMIGAVVGCCVTLDQAKAVMRFVEAIVDKKLRSTVAMTAARGRGKSAALGLAMACAVAYGYINIYVTAPSPENLGTMFEFIHRGFTALKYKEHQDYDRIQSTNTEFKKAVVSVKVRRERVQQTIQYIHPTEAHLLGRVDLLCIDEAAAIPLPVVKALLGPYLVFMSSTINGYEGTGRSLSLKLLGSLREKSANKTGASDDVTVRNLVEKLRTQDDVKKPDDARPGKGNDATPNTTKIGGRTLYELSLSESIRYHNGDEVESWLMNLLCLDVTNVARISEVVAPAQCQLVYVNRDTLFSYNPGTERFLKRLVSIYVASHYKNTPDDLQLLSDAPAHHLFCLISPVQPGTKDLPDIYCIIQVSMEGKIAKESILSSLSKGYGSAGDLIPWTVSQHFQDSDFPSLSGGRIMRIATHPDMQGKGYGKLAMKLLESYYEGRIPCTLEEEEEEEHTTSLVTKEYAGSLLEEQVKPRKNLPPLFQYLPNRRSETLDYFGVSFGLTRDLLRFWKTFGMAPVYLRETANDLTGENSCIMLKRITRCDADQTGADTDWLQAYWQDFCQRFVSRLRLDCFQVYRPFLALDVLEGYRKEFTKDVQSFDELDQSYRLIESDLIRAEAYRRNNNLVDYDLVLDLIPRLAQLFFLNRIDVDLEQVQMALLLGIGLQRKSIDKVKQELAADNVVLSLDQLHKLCYETCCSLIKCLRKNKDDVLNEEPVKRSSGEIVADPSVRGRIVEEVEQEELDDEVSDTEETERQKSLERLKVHALAQYSIAQKGMNSSSSAVIKGKEKKRKLLDRLREEDQERERQMTKKLDGKEGQKRNKLLVKNDRKHLKKRKLNGLEGQAKDSVRGDGGQHERKLNKNKFNKPKIERKDDSFSD